jgi:hypothetical protein
LEMNHSPFKCGVGLSVTKNWELDTCQTIMREGRILVGVWTGVCHREQSWTIVGKEWELILKLAPDVRLRRLCINGDATSPIILRDIASLDHKVFDNSMDAASAVTQSSGSSRSKSLVG